MPSVGIWKKKGENFVVVFRFGIVLVVVVGMREDLDQVRRMVIFWVEGMKMKRWKRKRMRTRRIVGGSRVAFPLCGG